MRKQVTHISPVQTAKVVALLYFAISLPIFACMFVAMLFFAAANQPPPFIFLGMPFIYGLVGFVFVLLGAWAYNLIAKRFGGIEYTAEETPHA